MAIGDKTWLLKPILQPALSTAFKKLNESGPLHRFETLDVPCHHQPMAKEQVTGLAIVKESKLLKPGWLARTHGLAKSVFTKLEVRWLMRTVRNFGQFG